MSNFSSAQKVLQTIRAGSEVERIRGENRVKINRAANGAPPLDAELAKKLGIKINVEWGELAQCLADARRQFLKAHTGNQNFFTVNIPSAPQEYQADWEALITSEINKPLRESLPYFELHRSKWSSVVSHGVGPMMWMHPDRWLPTFKAIADVRIATDTTLDFANLSWFAVRNAYSPFELMEEVFNDKPGNKWDKKAIAGILKSYKELNSVAASNNYDIETAPEKLLELLKQNGGFYSGDAMPSIPLWHFYFLDETDAQKKGWFMVVVPENSVVKGDKDNDNFLWQSDEPAAAKLEHLLHCQFGDLTADAPFKYHAVRSLGFMLLEPTYYRNLTRCRLLQHIHDNFNIWLRTTDPAEKARALIQEFSNMGVVRSGVSVIPAAERHQIDGELVQVAMADLKQLVGEKSGGYTQQQDTGTQKEQTAFETRVKTEQVNAQLGGILSVSFKYESFAQREICRRFCLPRTYDLDILVFQRKCREFGIPRKWLDVSLWEVEPVTPLGMGNPTVAQSAAQQLLSMRPMYSPSAQNEILHDATLVITGDPRKAARWAPIGGKPGVTDGAKFAAGIFGTLMQGVPLQPPEGLSALEQIDALLPLFGGKITLLTRRDNTASPTEAAGLQSVGQYLATLIQSIAQDPQQQQKVKQYSDALGQLMNQAKGLAQRGAQQAQANQAQPGEAAQQQAKLQTELHNSTVKAHADARVKEAKAAQQLQHKQQSFQGDQQRKDAESFAQIQREGVKTAAQIENEKKRAEAAPATNGDK